MKAVVNNKGLHQILADNEILDDEPVEVSFGEYDYKGDLFVMLGGNELPPPEIALDAI